MNGYESSGVASYSSVLVQVLLLCFVPPLLLLLCTTLIYCSTSAFTATVIFLSRPEPDLLSMLFIFLYILLYEVVRRRSSVEIKEGGEEESILLRPGLTVVMGTSM